MKKTVFLFFMLLSGIIAFHACEEYIAPPQNDKNVLEKCGNIGSRYDIVNASIVAPEGPDFDTRNVLNAFEEAKLKGPGSVVLLTEGTFYLDKMDIYNFDGWFKGMGKDKTEIRMLEEGLEVTTNDPFFISFRGGNIRISDMFFNVPGNNPCKPWELPTGETVTFIAAVVNIIGNSVENNKANSLFQNISFQGKYVDQFNFTPYNVDNFILLNGGALNIQPFEGHHVIQKCEFLSAETAINALGLSNSTLIVGGNHIMSNHIKDVNAGINIFDSEKSDLKCTNNHLEKIRDFGGIIFRQGVLPAFIANLNPDKSHFIAANNTIEVTGKAPAIDIHDYISVDDPAQFSEIVLLKNKIKLNNTEAKGIFANGANYVRAMQNAISGHSAYGIDLSGPAHHWKLFFNDFQNFDASYAEIVLGEETHHNFILCNRYSEINVEDNGTNNVVRQTNRKTGKRKFH